MALTHLQSGQVADIQALGEHLSLHKTAALFKAKHLEVIRLVLRSQQAMPPHKVSGDITIHCIEGQLEIALPSGSVTLGAGQLVLVEGGQLHGVRALAPSSALVTISLPADDH